MIPTRNLLPWLVAAAVTVACAVPPQALACAACFGRTDAALAKGMNAGIFAMLAFVGAAWIAFGSFFVFIVRRSRTHAEPLPGDTQDPQHN